MQEMFWQGTWGYLTALGSLQGLSRLVAVGEVTQLARERLTNDVAASKGYYYIMAVGGSTAAGRGSILSAVSGEADRAGVVCFAETFHGEQDSELKSAGFEVVQTRPQLFGLTVRYWMRASRNSSGVPQQDLSAYSLAKVDTGGYDAAELDASFRAHEEAEAQKERDAADAKKAAKEAADEV